MVREYRTFRDELAVADGLIFKGSSIVIPKALRKTILSQIHEAHLGIERSKLRARELVFWPGMSKQIEDMVCNCSTCQELRFSPPREPMIPHEIPQYPWQIIATDLFTWNGGNYVVVVDYYSRYWEIVLLNSTTSMAVINKLKQVFARHGIPETVKSDNGPQYSSSEFAMFATNWKFLHVTSSPRYPQSNGLAEKTVQTAKRMLEKAKRDRRDPYLALLEQRNTPVANYKSPAQLSMGRRLRSLLPCTASQLIPETVRYRDTQVRFQKKQAEQKANYDKIVTPLQPLKSGEAVRVKQEGEWRSAEGVELADTPRSYVVKTPEGAVYRRNRRNLLQDTSNSLVSNDTSDSRAVQWPAEQEQSQEQQPESLESRQHETNNGSDGYRTRSGRLVKVPDRYQA